MITKLSETDIKQSKEPTLRFSKGAKMSKLIHTGMFIFTAGFAFLTMINPASAASASCRIYPGVSSEHCETGTIPANRSGHFVRFYVSPGSTYKVKDETTKVVVATGTADWRGKSQTIFGLYGQEYKLYVDHAVSGFGYINNN